MKTNVDVAPGISRPQLQDREYDDHNGEIETLAFVDISRAQTNTIRTPA